MMQHISIVIKQIGTPPIPDTNDYNKLGISSGIIDHQISLKKLAYIFLFEGLANNSHDLRADYRCKQAQEIIDYF